MGGGDYAFPFPSLPRMLLLAIPKRVVHILWPPAGSPATEPHDHLMLALFCLASTVAKLLTYLADTDSSS